MPPAMTAWCHGAPGIGLARVDMLDVFDTPAIRQDIERALEATVKTRMDNHSLCHGSLGNLEFVLKAQSHFPRWKEASDALKEQTLKGLANGIVCGTSGRGETQGLMAGIAGVGLTLLRMEAPERIPCVLLLDAPPSPDSRRAVVRPMSA